jgi:hypothetical protein
MARTIRVLGIDIANLVCHIVGMDDSGHVALRRRMARGECCTVSRHCLQPLSAWKPVGV